MKTITCEQLDNTQILYRGYDVTREVSLRVERDGVFIGYAQDFLHATDIIDGILDEKGVE